MQIIIASQVLSSTVPTTVLNKESGLGGLKRCCIRFDDNSRLCREKLLDYEIAKTKKNN